MDRLRTVVWGRRDPRLRATWRYLLASPLLLSTGAVVGVVLPAVGIEGMLPGGLLQAGTFAVLLVLWARFVDQRDVIEYGLDVDRAWVGDLLVGFVAIVVAQGAWYGLGDSLGWTTLEATGEPTVAFGLTLATVLVAIAVNVWVQDTVYFGFALRSAAEGLRARGVDPRIAVLGGWLAAVVFFVAVHGGSFLRPGHFVAAAVFGSLYVHTGELALPIGFHLGVNVTGGWVFLSPSVASERVAAVAVTESVPLFDAVSGPAIVQMLLAYVLVAGWLRWRRGGVGIDAEVARWRPR